MKLFSFSMSHLDLDHQSDCLLSQIWLYLIKYLLQLEIMGVYGGHAQGAIKMSRILSHSATAWNKILYSCIFNSYLKKRLMWKFFWFTSCRCVYWCVCDDSQLCLVCVHSLITRLQLKKMSVMYESAHDAITFQLLEMSSITTPNQKKFRIFAQGTLFKGVFRENIGNFTELHNEKNQSGSKWNYFGYWSS